MENLVVAFAWVISLWKTGFFYPLILNQVMAKNFNNSGEVPMEILVVNIFFSKIVKIVRGSDL